MGFVLTPHMVTESTYERAPWWASWREDRLVSRRKVPCYCPLWGA